MKKIVKILGISILTVFIALGLAGYVEYRNALNEMPLDEKIELIQSQPDYVEIEDISQYLYNDLEYAIFDDYKELQNIKAVVPNSIMSGSGSTYFVLDNVKEIPLNSDYQVIRDLKFVDCGIKCNNFVTN